MRAPFRQRVVPSGLCLREEGSGTLGMEWSNFRDRSSNMGDVGAGLTYANNGQLRADTGRLQREFINPNLMMPGVSQVRGLIRRIKENLGVTRGESSRGHSITTADDTIGEVESLLYSEGLKRSHLKYFGNKENCNEFGYDRLRYR